jgi:hypothetical protein
MKVMAPFNRALIRAIKHAKRNSIAQEGSDSLTALTQKIKMPKCRRSFVSNSAKKRTLHTCDGSNESPFNRALNRAIKREKRKSIGEVLHH